MDKNRLKLFSVTFFSHGLVKPSEIQPGSLKHTSLHISLAWALIWDWNNWWNVYWKSSIFVKLLQTSSYLQTEPLNSDQLFKKRGKFEIILQNEPMHIIDVFAYVAWITSGMYAAAFSHAVQDTRKLNIGVYYMIRNILNS